MASRVGHISRVGDHRARARVEESTSLEELKRAFLSYIDLMDGRVRARNDTTGEEWAGRLVVMGGGMICFDTVDERGSEVDQEVYVPEEVTRAAEAKVKAGTEKVTIGK